MASSWQDDPSDYLQSAIGGPVTITSGYRTQQHNALVHGVPNSDHLRGQAYDFVPQSMSMADAATRLKQSGVPATKILNEGNHIHVSYPKGDMSQQGEVSDAQILAALRGGAPSAPASSAAPSQDSSDISDAQILAALRGTSKSAGSQTAPPQPLVPTQTQAPLLQRLSAGVVQGGRDVISSIDPIAQWADKHIGQVTLGGLLPTADQAHANSLVARNQFNQQYSGDTAATVGRVGGQIAASLPAFATGGELLAPAAAGLSAAVPAAAPAANFAMGAYKGNKLLQLASRGTAGALQGGAAAGLTSSASDAPIGNQLKQGAEFGGILGGGAPLLHDIGAGLYSRVTGGGVSPAKAALADKAVNQFGIPLRGSQISNSPFAHYLDSAVGKIPFSGMEGQNEAQRTAFSKAVAGTFGENADNLTPDVMSAARKRIGQVFDTVAAKTGVKDVPSLMQNLGNVVHEASQTLPEGSVTPLLKQVENIGSTVDPGTGQISGASYQALTRRGSPLDRAMNSSDSNIRHYAGEIKSALDDGLEASAAPEDLAALKQARLQWKNMRTVQDLASKAGIEGEISPALLLGAVKKSYKDMAYSGAGQIGDLAHIGQQFLKEPPSSGTGERQALYAMLGMGGEAGTEALLHNPNALIHAVITGAGLLGTSRGIASVLKSNAYRNMFLRSANGGSATNALLSGGSGIGNTLSHYAVPSVVIGGNQLVLNRPPVPGSP